MPKPKVPEKLLSEAHGLIAGGMSIRKAAKQVGIGATTLRRSLAPSGVSTPECGAPKGAPAPQGQAKIYELRPVPIADFRLVPRHLFEQVKGIEWDIDGLYANGNAMFQNPYNYLIALVDQHYKIRGVLWGAMNPLKKTLSVYLVSVEKEYQDRGAPLVYSHKILDQLREKLGLRALEWITQHPRAFERLGARRSKHIIMEV